MTKILLTFVFLFCAVPMFMEARRTPISTKPCPTPFLEHGRSRLRGRTHTIRYICDPRYELVGSRYATCRGGEWDEPMPICIRPGCKLPVTSNLHAVYSRDDAWVIFFCYPGHKLVGSQAMYCDGFKWNTTVPTCVSESAPPQLSCDFESRDLCGWQQDEFHDFDWRRNNFKTPSSFAFTGPSYDHTLGKGNTGFYMYIESSSRFNNDSARLISPVFESSLSKNGCFSFFYHMFGQAIGGLRVYQVADKQAFMNLSEAEKPELLLFDKWGNQGDVWYGSVSKLKEMTTDFQIVVEGIRGPSFTSDIAIDDVSILQGDQCVKATLNSVTPPEFPLESCEGRCDVFGSAVNTRGCGCTVSCLNDENCCGDFFDLCVFAAGTSDSDEDSSPEGPHTEKLIGTTTTTQTPTTKTTTKSTTPTTRTYGTHEPPSTAPRVTTKATKPTTMKVTTAKSVKLTTPPTTVKTFTGTLRRNTTVKMTTPSYIASKTTSTTMGSIHGRTAAVAKSKDKGSSGPVVLLTIFALAVCGAAALVALRTARGRAAWARLRGRAAWARLRGRASSDPEVRYLTHDTD